MVQLKGGMMMRKICSVLVVVALGVACDAPRSKSHRVRLDPWPPFSSVEIDEAKDIAYADVEQGTQPAQLIDLSIFGGMALGLTADEALQRHGEPDEIRSEGAESLRIYRRRDATVAVVVTKELPSEPAPPIARYRVRALPNNMPVVALPVAVAKIAADRPALREICILLPDGRAGVDRLVLTIDHGRVVSVDALPAPLLSPSMQD